MRNYNHGWISLMMIFVLSVFVGCSQESTTDPVADSTAIEKSLGSQAKNVFISYDGQRPDDVLKASGVQVIRQYKYIPAIYASMPAENVAGLKGNAKIRFVEDEFIKYPGEQSLEWWADRIDAEYVHAATGNRGAGVNVAVLDSGGDMDHPDLTWAGGIRVMEGTDPLDWEDKSGHGTHCSGIISADDNDIGVVGVAPECNLYMVAIFSVKWVAGVDLIAGIEWCLDTHYDADPDNDIQIMSMSVGGDESWVEEMYFQAAYDAGILLVASAMNNSGPVQWPAAYDCVMAISATTSWEELYSASNFGPEIELTAPGAWIYSTHRRGGYKTLSGTSMACPMVAGAAACVWSANPTFTNAQVRERLRSTAEWIPELTADEQGSGIVDVENAVMGTTNGDNYIDQ